MRSIRMRVFATFIVLAAAGAGAWQLLPEREEQGKTISVGTTDAVTSLDPAGAYDAGSWALYSNVFQSLLTFDAGGAAPVPDAAEHCGFVGQGLLTYRCELRDGLKFPSGRAVTAKDVKFSFDRVRAINSPVGPATLLDTLGKVETSGARTVTFSCPRPTRRSRSRSPRAPVPSSTAPSTRRAVCVPVPASTAPAPTASGRTRPASRRSSSPTPATRARSRASGSPPPCATSRTRPPSNPPGRPVRSTSPPGSCRPRCSPRTRRATRGSGSPRSRARRPGISSSMCGRAARCTTAGCGRPSPRSSTGTGWSPRRTKAPSTPSTP
jgi:hypothetical protein